MKFTLEIKSSGAAFEPDAALEVENLLNIVCIQLEDGGISNKTHKIYDANGNECGFWILNT